MSNSSLSVTIADTKSRIAEDLISNGNVQALRWLLDDWARDERAKDERLARYVERLGEMQAIELEHGGFSLRVFEEGSSSEVRSPSAAARLERWSKRASDLMALKGPEWWAWAHRPCLPNPVVDAMDNLLLPAARVAEDVVTCDL